MKLNQYFDHTLLKPEATTLQVQSLCAEAKTYGFYAVCVNSSMVDTAAKALEGTPVKVAAVVGFPLGACTTSVKVFETEEKVVYAHTKDDMFQVKYRLYELEEILPGYFMRISKSTILNAKKYDLHSESRVNYSVIKIT